MLATEGNTSNRLADVRKATVEKNAKKRDLEEFQDNTTRATNHEELPISDQPSEKKQRIGKRDQAAPIADKREGRQSRGAEKPKGRSSIVKQRAIDPTKTPWAPAVQYPRRDSASKQRSALTDKTNVLPTSKTADSEGHVTGLKSILENMNKPSSGSKRKLIEGEQSESKRTKSVGTPAKLASEPTMSVPHTSASTTTRPGLSVVKKPKSVQEHGKVPTLSRAAADVLKSKATAISSRTEANRKQKSLPPTTNEFSASSHPATNKRKLDNVDKSSNKKQRIEEPVCRKEAIRAPKSSKTVSQPDRTPRALYNSGNAGYINAALQLFHNVPELTRMRTRPGAGVNAFCPLAENQLWELATKRAEVNGKGTKRLMTSLNKALETSKDWLDTKDFIVPFLKQMSSGIDEVINPIFFHHVCGLHLKNVRFNESMNGDRQEDVALFLDVLLKRLTSEGAGKIIDEVFGTEFEHRMRCKRCSAENIFVSKNLILKQRIPEGLRDDEAWTTSGALMDALVHDNSAPKALACETCSHNCEMRHGPNCDKGCMRPRRMIRNDDKRLSHASKFLLTSINRDGAYEEQQKSEGRGASKRDYTEIVQKKLGTKVRLSMEPYHLVCKDGTKVSYELSAVIEHEGTSMRNGRYSTCRKIGNKWFRCNDSNFGGVKEVIESAVETSGHAHVCLYKKIEINSVPNF